MKEVLKANKQTTPPPAPAPQKTKQNETTKPCPFRDLLILENSVATLDQKKGKAVQIGT